MNASLFRVRIAATVLMGSLVIRATAFLVTLAKTAKRVCFFVKCVRFIYLVLFRYW